MKKRFGLTLALAAVLAFCGSAFAADIADFDGLKNAFATGGDYKLTADVTISENITTTKDVILDLNGHTIDTTPGTWSSFVEIRVGDGTTAGKLTLNNSTPASGGIVFKTASSGSKTASSIKVYGCYTEPVGSRTEIKSVLTINSGVKITSEGYYCVRPMGLGATINIYGGELTSRQTDIDSGAIAGNGTAKYGGTVINITGGVIKGGTVVDPSSLSGKESSGGAIYHPQTGVLNISGGTLSGYDGVQMKAGTLNMTGGTIISTGAKITPTPSHNGSVATGSALSLITCSAYTGEINVTISGAAKLEAKGANADAIYEAIIEQGSSSTESRVKKVAISGGTITGAGSALSFENSGNVITYEFTGGTYSSDPSQFVSSPYVVKQSGGKYVIQLAGVAVTPSTKELVLGVSPTATLTAASDITEDFTWTTDDATVATVNGGVVTAHKAGKTNICATGGTSGSVGKCEVTVRSAAAVKLSDSTLSLTLGGDPKTLDATYEPGDTIEWSTSNSAVATVESGKVTAVKAGIATVTAKGSKSGLSAGCTVTVVDPAKPDPIPTPEPVEASTVGKEANPVNSEADKPADVEAATPSYTEATADNMTAMASTTGIDAKNLAASPTGQIVLEASFAKTAIEELISGDATISPDQILLLPIVSATVTANNVAALAFKGTGAQVGAQADTVASDIRLVKILKNGKAETFGYAATAADYKDKYFTIKGEDGKCLAADAPIEANTTYTFIAFVKDNGDFDLDPAAGSVVDPLALATNTATEPKPHKSSSGGCSAGFGAFALLLLAPVVIRKKK